MASARAAFACRRPRRLPRRRQPSPTPRVRQRRLRRSPRGGMSAPPPLGAACCPHACPLVARVAWVTPPCAPALATPRGRSALAAVHPSLLAGDRQVLAGGGCCNRQGL